jgi:hypothetical protein
MRPWSKEETQYLIENRLLGSKELSEVLNRTQTSIIQKAFKLKIYLHESVEPKKDNIRKETPRKTCPCGKPAASKGYDIRGYKVWNNKCESCRYHAYRKYKKDHCESCGFVAIHSSQLDIDHIDGVHSNNNESNLQTLCANCHRLKTHLNKDYMRKQVT